MEKNIKLDAMELSRRMAELQECAILGKQKLTLDYASDYAVTYWWLRKPQHQYSK